MNRWECVQCGKKGQEFPDHGLCLRCYSNKMYRVPEVTISRDKIDDAVAGLKQIEKDLQ